MICKKFTMRRVVFIMVLDLLIGIILYVLNKYFFQNSSIFSDLQLFIVAVVWLLSFGAWLVFTFFVLQIGFKTLIKGG